MLLLLQQSDVKDPRRVPVSAVTQFSAHEQNIRNDHNLSSAPLLNEMFLKLQLKTTKEAVMKCAQPREDAVNTVTTGSIHESIDD